MTNQSSNFPEVQLSEFNDRKFLEETTQEASVESELAQRAVNALKQSDARFQAVFENSAV